VVEISKRFGYSSILNWGSGTSITMFVFFDHDFILTASHFGDMTAFMAILATFSLRVGRNGYL